MNLIETVHESNLKKERFQSVSCKKKTPKEINEKKECYRIDKKNCSLFNCDCAFLSHRWRFPRERAGESLLQTSPRGTASGLKIRLERRLNFTAQGYSYPVYTNNFVL